MAGNRKRHTNTVQVGSLLKGVVAAFFLGVVGLSYVYLSNQMHTRGNDIIKLEKELSDIKVLNQDEATKIEQLSSRSELQRKLNTGFIKMIPITDDRIVRINTPANGQGDEIRAVANRGTEK
jgi:hypothetical protein